MKPRIIKIAPIPVEHGIGVTADGPLDGHWTQKRRYEQVGRYHNYHVTVGSWEFPKQYLDRRPIDEIIDGFSPNLNKTLHIGHLRNLIIAASICRLTAAVPVAMLGATLGIKTGAEADMLKWFNLAGYIPAKWYDVLLPTDWLGEGIKVREQTDEQGTCLVWDGPKGPVVLQKSDGKKTYAYHDLMFAALAKPTKYITGAEQQDHFASLGLGDKHLPMGLVLGEDGKKIKSRDGEALSGDETMKMIIEKLDESPDTKKLAWNILAWNFLSVSREQNVKFVPEEWTRAESPGMYITYTYARIQAALEKCPYRSVGHFEMMSPEDAKLVGFAEYYWYYSSQATKNFDPTPIAHFAHDLARRLGTLYHEVSIKDSGKGFIDAMAHANHMLGHAMGMLGMYPLLKV